ncbi:MAG: GNAT family N-acetyltransferase [Bacteroidota bacterium]
MVRSAKSSDIPSLVELHLYAWIALYKNWVRPDQQPSLDRSYRSEKFQRMIASPDHVVLVAEVSGRVVGMALAGPNIYYPDPYYTTCIECLYVYKAYIRQSIGDKLFDTLLAQLKVEGKKRVMLWCIAKNEAGRRFFSQKKVILSNRFPCLNIFKGLPPLFSLGSSDSNQFS